MNGVWDTVRAVASNVGLLVRAGAGSLRAHWALSFFSVAVAFGIWFIVQDVENPRVERVVPVEARQAIPVRVLNQSDDIIVLDPGRVRVRVDAREEDIPELRASDFRATVDAEGLVAGQTVERPVRVETVNGDSVRVIEVVPHTLQLRAVAAVSREVIVTPDPQGELPSGYEQDGLPTFTPTFITITGTREQVDMVATVQAEIPLSGLRSPTTMEVPVVARTANGNEVDVILSQQRVQVALNIVPTFAQRQVPLRLTVSGQPALGYHVVGRTIDPPFVTIEGPPNIIDGIEFVSLGRIDVSGAETEVNESRIIEVPPNVTADVQTALVRVAIAPIVCGVQDDAPCAGQTFVAPVTFENVPAGLSVSGGPYSAQVPIVGPLAQLRDLALADVVAVVSLAGGTVGTQSYTVQVSLPAGLSVAGQVTLDVTLVGP